MLHYIEAFGRRAILYLSPLREVVLRGLVSNFPDTTQCSGASRSITATTPPSTFLLATSQGDGSRAGATGLVGTGGLDVDDERAFRRGDGVAVTATTTQHVGDGDGEDGARDGTDRVDPEIGEVGGHEIGSEGSRRVHRGARQRAGPQSGQGDVAPDAEGAQDADVLRARGSAENYAHEAHGQDDFHPQGRAAGKAVRRVVRPVEGRDL